MLTSPELISVTAETSHPQPRKTLSMEGERAEGWVGGANDKGERREEKEGG